MIIKPLENGVLTDEFLQTRFANKWLQDQRTLRIGNVISFVSPVEFKTITTAKSDSVINFMLEIPDISNYAGVCFQRLFITNVANILAVRYLKCDIEIKNDEIVVKKEHVNQNIRQLDGIVSINHIANINGAIVIYLGLYNKAGDNSPARAYSLNMKQEDCYKFMDMVNENFYFLANGIFLRTAKM